LKIAFGEALTLLTERQKEIIRMECDGYTNWEIADRLGISTTTVENEKKKYNETIRKTFPNPCK
jgi:RNA polymerase sigma factor (sigma-70 family)